MAVTEVTIGKREFIRKRTTELLEKIRLDVMPNHRRRCEEREKLYPNQVRLDDEITRALNSNSLVAELRRLQNSCPHDFTDWQEDSTWPVLARTRRCRTCQSNETDFDDLKGEKYGK